MDGPGGWVESLPACLEFSEFLTIANRGRGRPIRDPACWALQARNVVGGDRLFGGTPCPEVAGKVVELISTEFVSMEFASMDERGKQREEDGQTNDFCNPHRAPWRKKPRMDFTEQAQCSSARLQDPGPSSAHCLRLRASRHRIA